MAKIDFILQKFQDTIYKKENTNIYHVLNSMAIEFDIFLEQMEKVKNSKFIDYAIGNEIDKIGAIINLTRYFGEGDSAFRSRIKAMIPSFIGGGTLGAIQTVVQYFLGVTPMIIEHYLPGNEHPDFVNGFLSGAISTIKNGSGLILNISPGYSYMGGSRITSISTDLTIPINTTQYIKLNSDGTLVLEVNNVLNSQLLVSSVTTDGANITNITDNRVILDPFSDSITNIASITVQIPYNFSEGFITIDNVKDILKKTKAAGIALLVNIVQTFEENINLNDIADAHFIVGFSQLGDSNLIGSA